MNPSESGNTDLHVQHIACVNNGAFLMKFEVERVAGGKAGDSGNYPAGKTRSLDLSTLTFRGNPLAVGEQVRPVVHVVAGRTHSGPAVSFAPNGHTATFSVHGTTLIYSIDRV